MNLCENLHEIIVSNVNKSETLKCPLYLLKGSIRNPCRYTEINISSQNAVDYSYSFCQNSGKFKVLVGDLVNGENRLTISYCKAIASLTVVYELPQNVNYTIRVLYIICKNHDGCFQSPSSDNTIDDACDRLTVGIKLVQSLFCDKLLEQGFGRKTFQLSSKCVPFHSQLTMDEAKQMDENSLWNYFAREVITAEFFENQKFIAFIGCTEYQGISDGNYVHDNIKLHTVANAALGGGDFALFGTGCLYTWPKSISEVVKCFESTEPVNVRNFLDDSNSRRTFGGCFATTLGSVCHEIGHIFDLGHSKCGIMGNGFDFVNRVFTVTNQTLDLPNRITSSIIAPKEKIVHDPRLTKLRSTNKFLNLFHHQKGNDLTYFERNSAITLAYHKWFNQYSNTSPGMVRCTNKGKIRLIQSKKYPIRLIEFRDKDNALMQSFHSFLDECVLEYAIPENIAEGSCDIIVIDDLGNIFKF